MWCTRPGLVHHVSSIKHRKAGAPISRQLHHYVLERLGVPMGGKDDCCDKAFLSSLWWPIPDEFSICSFSNSSNLLATWLILCTDIFKDKELIDWCCAQGIVKLTSFWVFTKEINKVASHMRKWLWMPTGFGMNVRLHQVSWSSWYARSRDLRTLVNISLSH